MVIAWRRGPQRYSEPRAATVRGMVSSAACPDCERPIAVASADEATPAFCSQCGQRLDVRSLRVTEILGEALGSLFTLELPILRTTRDLLRWPGRVAAAWIAGKRRTYINPLKFIVIIGAAVALLHRPLLRLHAARAPRGQAVQDVGLGHLSSDLFAFVCLGLLVPIALALAWLGPLFRARRPWLDWYVLGLYTYGLGAALQLAIGVASLAFAAGTAPHTTALVLKGFAPLLLLTWGAFGFVERGARWRAAGLAAVAQLGVIAIAVATTALASGG